MIYSVSYNYVDKIITVTLSDRTQRVYTEDMRASIFRTSRTGRPI